MGLKRALKFKAAQVPLCGPSMRNSEKYKEYTSSPCFFCKTVDFFGLDGAAQVACRAISVEVKIDGVCGCADPDCALNNVMGEILTRTRHKQNRRVLTTGRLRAEHW